MLAETTEVQELSLEKVIETKLVQNNVTDQVIGALKEKYGGMTLKALDDKESYLELKLAAKDCQKVRTLAAKICKEGREDAVKQQKLWIAKEKEVIGRVAEVEDALCAEIQKFDDEVDRKAAEEKQRQEEAYINRQAALTKMGARYEAGSFVLGDASFEAELIKGASQDIWEEAVLPKFTAEYNTIEAARIEEERLKQEAEAERKRQHEELLRQQEEFRQQQAEFQRQQEEVARKQREKAEAEERERIRLQNELQTKRLNAIIAYNPQALDISVNKLWDMSEEAFAETLELAKNAHAKAEEEKQQRIAELAAQKERERIAEETRIAEEKRKKEEAEAAERLAQSSDKVKYADLIAKISVIHVPEMRSGQYRTKALAVSQKLKEILTL